MKSRSISIMVVVLLLLSGCGGADQVKPLSFEEIEPVERQAEIDRAKEIVLEMEEVIDVKGVQFTHLLFLAPEVKQFDRMKLKHIRQDAFKRVKDEFPKSKVHVSTDKKIYMELEKLEEQLYNGDITAEDLKKKLMKLEEDMKG